MGTILKTSKESVKLETLKAVVQSATPKDPDEVRYTKDIQYAQCLINCADMLMTISTSQIEAAVELYKKRGCLIHGLKYTFNQCRKAFDNFLNASANSTKLLTPSENLQRTIEFEGLKSMMDFFMLNEVRFEKGEGTFTMIARPAPIAKNCLMCKHYKTPICPTSQTEKEPQAHTCLAYVPHEKTNGRQELTE